MRRRNILLNIVFVMIVLLCVASFGAIILPNRSNEVIIAVVSLDVALLALYISLRTFYSIDEVNAISRMDGNVMENPRYRPNILKAIFEFPQIKFSETSEALMSHMEKLFNNSNKQSGAHLADNVQEVANIMVLIPFFIHTNNQKATSIHLKRVSALLKNMKHRVDNFKEISDGSCKLLDETVSLINAIFAYQNVTDTGKSDPSKLLEIRGSIFVNPVTCILYNNYLGLYFLRRARMIIGGQKFTLSPRELISNAKACPDDDKAMALVYCSKALESFKRAKEQIGDDMIWNGFVCFNLARAEYLKQILNESFVATSSNDWETYINESIRSWMTSNKIIAEHFVSKNIKDLTFLQQALISQENKVRLSKVILQMMKNQPLTDYNGNPWVKQYDDITQTSFFKGLPEEDPQKQTDSLVEDIKELIKKNQN